MANRSQGDDRSPVRKSSLVRISFASMIPSSARRWRTDQAQVIRLVTFAVQQEGVRASGVIEEQLERFAISSMSRENLFGITTDASNFLLRGHEQEVLRSITEAEILYNEATTNRAALETRLGRSKRV